MLFAQSIRNEIEARAALELELVSALANDEFELFYQPQVKLRDLTVVGAEALIRWRHPRRVGGTWTVHAGRKRIINRKPAFRMGAAHRVQAGAPLGARRLPIAHRGQPLTVAVRGRRSRRAVDQALRESNLTADLLELEVTENIFLDSTSNVLNTLDRYGASGCVSCSMISARAMRASPT